MIHKHVTYNQKRTCKRTSGLAAFATTDPCICARLSGGRIRPAVCCTDAGIFSRSAPSHNCPEQLLNVALWDIRMQLRVLEYIRNNFGPASLDRGGIEAPARPFC